MKQAAWKSAVLMALIAAIAVVLVAKNRTSTVQTNSEPRPSVRIKQNMEPDKAQAPVAEVKPGQTGKKISESSDSQPKSEKLRVKEKPQPKTDSQQVAKALQKQLPEQSTKTSSAPRKEPARAKASESSSKSAEKPAAKKLPKMLELGADKCVPCKMMKPIIDELKSEYKGRVEIVFIDVWKNPGVAEQYNIESIPTQIFYDSSGNEVFRHSGFFPKEEIIAKLAEMGVD